MNIHFLGGADEVGASSTLITIDGQHILVERRDSNGGESAFELAGS